MGWRDQVTSRILRQPPRDDPSVMDGYAAPEPQSGYVNTEPPLEAPMFSPDDLLGTGIGKALLAGGTSLGGLASMMLRGGSVPSRMRQSGAMPSGDFLAARPEFADTIFKDEAGALKQLYHGTSKDKDFGTKFAANRRGNFIGESPKEASSYALDNESMRSVYNPDKRRYEPQNTASRVLPVFANVKNPYRLTPEEIEVYRMTPNYVKAQKEIMARAVAQGHDAVMYPDGGIAVADPNNIASALSLDKKRR